MAWYYRYELKGIQRWILDSNRLRELAGGSKLIEALGEEARTLVQAAGGAELYAAAGGLTAVFPSRETLERFAAEWPMRVYYTAPGLPMVQAWVERSPDSAEALGLLARRLVARRNLPQPVFPEAGPWMARVGRTGQPAVLPEDGKVRGPKRPSYDRAGLAKETCVDAGEIHELEDWPEGLVAVVHADGSGIGQRIHKLGGSRGAHKAFSDALTATTETATAAAQHWLETDAVRTWKGLLGPQGVYQRPIVEGGDDLTYLLPAAPALGFVEVWLQTFEQESRNRAAALGGAGLHAAAGIAFVHKGHPFWRAYDIAESACAAAKHDLATGGRPTGSGLRLVRLTSSLSADNQPAAQAPTWSLAQLCPLTSLVGAVGRLPRGGLRRWLTLAEAGPLAATARDRAWHRLAELAGDDPEASRAWSDLQTALGQLDGDAATGLFTTASGRKGTPLADALALAHLQRGGK